MRLVILVLIMLTVLSVAAAGIAVSQRDLAVQQRNLSQQALNLYKRAQAAQLDRSPIRVTLEVDSQALLDSSPAAIASVRSQVARIPALANKHAGLVLSFAGSNDGNYARAVKVASMVNHALTAPGGDGIFTNAVFQAFAAPSQPSDAVRLDIYLFKGP